MIEIRDKAEETCQSIDIHDPVRTHGHLDKMTFEDWVKSQGGGETALASATVWTRAMLGLDPSEMSALFFLHYCKSGGGLSRMRSDRKDGGQYLRLVKGMYMSKILKRQSWERRYLTPAFIMQAPKALRLG